MTVRPIVWTTPPWAATGTPYWVGTAEGGLQVGAVDFREGLHHKNFAFLLSITPPVNLTPPAPYFQDGFTSPGAAKEWVQKWWDSLVRGWVQSP